MALSELTQRCLERGRALFNSGAHWEAHEAWEEAWLEESGEVRQLLQGLIQAAAALHKAFVQKQPTSCVKLFTTSLQKLWPLQAELGGLQLDAFRAEARTALAAAERWAAGEAADFPREATPFLAVVGEDVRPPG